MQPESQWKPLEFPILCKFCVQTHLGEVRSCSGIDQSEIMILSSGIVDVYYILMLYDNMPCEETRIATIPLTIHHGLS